MKFNKEKMEFLGGYVTTFSAEGTSQDPFRIVVTDHGVYFEGKTEYICTHADLSLLAKTISDAWSEYERLKRKLIPPIGH